MRVNRRGVTRTVILTKLRGGSLGGRSPRGVMQSILWGIQSNLSECDWSGSPGTCPVLWSFAGLINVYPRCEPVTWEPTDEEYDAIGLLGPGDRKPENLGLLNGKLVWIDYSMSGTDWLHCERRHRCLADHDGLTQSFNDQVEVAMSDGFELALLNLKQGRKVTRANWNAPGQFVVLQKGYPDGIAINANTAEATGIEQGTVCIFRPYLMLRTADGSFVPWVPTVSDVLAEDWEIRW